MTFEEFWAEYQYESADVKADIQTVWDSATAAERERCAKIVEKYRLMPDEGIYIEDVDGNHTFVGIDAIAAAIRKGDA
jgi:hypothetical protein